MRPIKDRYGNKLTKKQRKPRKPYWRLTRMLTRLRLKSQERDHNTASFNIIVPDFGLVFKFNKAVTLPQYQGWDVIDVDLEELEINDIKFGEDLMWLLISKGYMSYLRNGGAATSQAFDFFISKQGWGLKIIEKRLELYNDEPRHAYNIKMNTQLRDMSISRILHHYPDFFDYLW
jgi:hypothetical protein